MISRHGQNLAYNWTGYQLGGNVQISIGDVDGDNRLEVIATCCGSRGNPASLFLFDWNGRTFIERNKVSLGRIERIRSIKAGKFTGKKGDDLVIATDNYFFIYRFDGGEIRRIFQSKYLGGQVVDIEIKDVTGDGQAELVIAVEGVGVQIYRWSGSQALLIGEIKERGKVRVAVGDTMGTGEAQIVVLKIRGGGRDVLEVFSMRNLQLQRVAIIKLTVMATGPIKTGRLSGSRREEIIVVTDGGRRVLVLGWQHNKFERIALSDSLSSQVREFAIGDWENSRDNQLVLGLANVIVVLRLRSGKLILVETIETPDPLTGLRMGDLNANGRQEIVIGTQNGSVFFVHKIVEIIVKPRLPVIVAPKPQPIIEPKSQFLVRERIIIPPKFPDVIKVADVKAKARVTSVKVITNKVIVSGHFDVDILVVVEPDRQVLAFSSKVPFTHFVHIPGLNHRHRVRADVEVVFVDFRFDPKQPRQIDVIIVAEIFVFDHIVRTGETIVDLADKWQTDVNVIVKINQLSSSDLKPGQRLKMPIDLQ